MTSAESETLVAEPARGGRPRSEEREREILEAALNALVEEGYGAMTIEGIAARVGAGKATLYRRWRNKAELVSEAIRRYGCASVPLVDTGDLRHDLRTFYREAAASYAGRDGELMAAFTSERIRYPELAEEFDRQFVSARRTHLRTIITNAIARGDLPADSDVDLLVDVGPALMLQRVALRREQLTPDLADRIVDQFFPVFKAGR